MFSDTDGSKYEGGWSNDMRNGVGSLVSSDSSNIYDGD